MATLKASGVEVKILTGDNDIVTRKMAEKAANYGPEVLRMAPMAMGSETVAHADRRRQAEVAQRAL